MSTTGIAPSECPFIGSEQYQDANRFTLTTADEAKRWKTPVRIGKQGSSAGIRSSLDTQPEKGLESKDCFGGDLGKPLSNPEEKQTKVSTSKLLMELRLRPSARSQLKWSPGLWISAETVQGSHSPWMPLGPWHACMENSRGENSC